MGHSLIPVLPALVQLQCSGKFFKNIAGVRVNGKIILIQMEQRRLLIPENCSLLRTDFQESRYSRLADMLREDCMKEKK